MSMYNLIEHRNNYSKAWESLWQYYRDQPNGNIANSESFRSKIKVTVDNPDADNKKKLK